MLERLHQLYDKLKSQDLQLMQNPPTDSAFDFQNCLSANLYFGGNADKRSLYYLTNLQEYIFDSGEYRV